MKNRSSIATSSDKNVSDSICTAGAKRKKDFFLINNWSYDIFRNGSKKQRGTKIGTLNTNLRSVRSHNLTWLKRILKKNFEFK